MLTRDLGGVRVAVSGSGSFTMEPEEILRRMDSKRLDLQSKWAYGVAGSWTERALLLIESGGSELPQCCDRGKLLVD